MKHFIFLLILTSSLLLSPSARAQNTSDDPLVRLVNLQTAGLAPVFALESLATDFKKLADASYTSKGPIYAAAIKLVNTMPMNDVLNRLFLMNAMMPLIEETHTAYFEETIIPIFNHSLSNLNTQHSVTNLDDLHNAYRSTLISLTLVRYGLDSLEQNMGTDEEHKQIGQMRAAIGVALASGIHADVIKCVSVFAANKDLLLNASVNPSTGPVGLMVNSLIEFLKL